LAWIYSRLGGPSSPWRTEMNTGWSDISVLNTQHTNSNSNITLSDQKEGTKTGASINHQPPRKRSIKATPFTGPYTVLFFWNGRLQLLLTLPAKSRRQIPYNTLTSSLKKGVLTGQFEVGTFSQAIIYYYEWPVFFGGRTWQCLLDSCCLCLCLLPSQRDGLCPWQTALQPQQSTQL
jgi:hypothetical protein